MATTHIGAAIGDIADVVLLPGDPLRAKYISENFLSNTVCYNTIRNMYGYTGTFKGKKISVQGTGMGVPSISIYATELIKDFGVRTLLRIGTCGSISSKVGLGQLFLAQGASTDNGVNRLLFKGMTYAPLSDFKLLSLASRKAAEKSYSFSVGNVLTSDSFYNEDESAFELWEKYGVHCIEMETSALYTIAARYNAAALSILSVSDHILTGEVVSPETRQTGLSELITLALEVASDY
ncbi:MAG: purine-nucleoside phosphorylase [Deltaproteobacteria bacterium]|nr:purine-nucleoside phosphorylase [Deltaproteobacteria bacterium]